jgi:hypothetical protein
MGAMGFSRGTSSVDPIGGQMLGIALQAGIQKTVIAYEAYAAIRRGDEISAAMLIAAFVFQGSYSIYTPDSRAVVVSGNESYATGTGGTSQGLPNDPAQREAVIGGAIAEADDRGYLNPSTPRQVSGDIRLIQTDQYGRPISGTEVSVGSWKKADTFLTRNRDYVYLFGRSDGRSVTVFGSALLQQRNYAEGSYRFSSSYDAALYTVVHEYGHTLGWRAEYGPRALGFSAVGIRYP